MTVMESEAFFCAARKVLTYQEELFYVELVICPREPLLYMNSKANLSFIKSGIPMLLKIILIIRKGMVPMLVR
jgi:hypothetical protein